MNRHWGSAERLGMLILIAAMLLLNLFVLSELADLGQLTQSEISSMGDVFEVLSLILVFLIISAAVDLLYRSIEGYERADIVVGLVYIIAIAVILRNSMPMSSLGQAAAVMLSLVLILKGSVPYLERLFEEWFGEVDGL